MFSKKLKNRIEKILEIKSFDYKKKYFLLTKIAETNIFLNKENLEKFQCFTKSLNESNGKFPSEDSLFSLYEKQIFLEKKSKKVAVKFKNRLIKECNLFYSRDLDSHESVLESLLETVVYNNKKLDKKLEEVLNECLTRNISLLTEASYTDNIIDLTNIFSDVEVDPKQLSQISAEEYDEDDEEEEQEVTAQKIQKTSSKVIDIFAPITNNKDPRKVSKEALANMLGFAGNGKYKPGQTGPVLSGWDKIEMKVLQQMSPYGRSSGVSTVGQRKWWIIESIRLCLMLEKQANFFLGISDEEKSRIMMSKDEKAKVGSLVADMRPYGNTLSDSEIMSIKNDLDNLLIQGEYDLENSKISENQLLRLLSRATHSRKTKVDELKKELDFMYPLHDTRPDFERAPQLSDEDRQATQDEVEDYFRQKDQETRDVYGDEIDPETGEPLYADEEQIRQINRLKGEQKKEIVKKEIIQNISNTRYLNMTAKEAKEYLRKLDDDLLRLAELFEKATDTLNPKIFSEFRTDSQGNILPDIAAIPDIIPAEELSEEEIKEIEDIIERMSSVDFVKMINDCEREQIYQDLVDRAVTVDEFIAYNKRFGLEDSDQPMTWEDIKRASAGEFTGSAGARQYGVKAWIKSVFFNFSPNDKSDIYSYLAERWYERLKQLDLIDDQAFAIKQDRVNPDDPSLDKAIPRKALDAAEAMGKYKRSGKLVDISNMLELVSKYTSPKYVKRYFDDKRDDNLPQAVGEKLQQIQTFAESAEEYDILVKRLEAEDPDTMAFAIMESMFNDKSGFRIFATGLLKEFYNNKVWPETEIALAQAVKQYFAKNYPAAGIAKSLGADEGADAVRPDEGKDLFNKIIYVAMERTGIKTSGKGVPNVGDSVEERKKYLRGQMDSRGDFAKAVADYNAKYQSGKNPLSGKYGSVFNKDDVEDLIDDVFSNSGIIGKVSGQLKRLNATSAGEIIAWIGDYPEGKLDQAIMLGMSLSDFYRREDANAMLTLPIEEIGKDTAKAVSDYKKKYGKLLTSSDFTEWLDDFLGVEPIDPKAKGVKKPGGKSFQ